jgi:dTDP-4-amino-4,6-dideoxygalactose transaminase
MQLVMERCDFALGDDVRRFENGFAKFCGVEHAVGVDSGLSALELSLRALGVGPGDEVIVPAHTFMATAAAVTFAGAEAVLVDVDPRTYNIDPAQVEAAITPRTRAIVPVHLYGQPADMDALMDLAEAHDLVVVEDACQAHGAYYRAQRAGSIGHAAAFSFYPTKNLGGCGDGGMVVTDDARVAEDVRAMRNCGQRVKYVHELPPFNHRLDTLQAAVLRVKLQYLDAWNESRRQAAARYGAALADAALTLPFEDPAGTHVYHLYVIRTSKRDALQAYLKQHSIGIGIHYPVPVHLQPFYADRGYERGQFPVTEQLCDEILSLPMFPGMTGEQVNYVAEKVTEFVRSSDLSLRATPDRVYA